jgi:hypothetical protein
VSPRAAPSGEGGGGARAGLVALVVAVVALGMFLLTRASPSTSELDPRSSRADGARGLVLLLEQQGADVEIGAAVPPRSDAASGRRVLLLDDRLDDAQREAMLDFVDAGGVLVVADPRSSLHGGDGAAAVRVERGSPLYADVGTSADATNNVRNEICDIPALERLRGLYVDDGLLFPVRAPQQRCFGTTDLGPSDEHAFVIRRDVGDGTIVGLGDNHLFTNEWLRFADNSGLATALLAPEDVTAVTIVLGSGAPRTVDDVGTGEDSLSDLVRPGVWMAFVQLALAFVVFAAARGVRVGRPVSEPRPVPLAGSELVRASGSVMRVARHHERAAWMLRTELHRDLCRRYRIDHGSSTDQVAWTAQDRDGIEPALARHALTADATDDRSLLALAQSVDQIREHLARVDARASEGATP